MTLKLHVMDAANQLGPLAKELRAEGEASLARIGERLGVRGMDVALYVHPNFVIPETGLCGYAPLPHWVQVTLDPANPNFAASWRRELRPTLAHELHHALRWQGPGYGSTLLEALVSEGLAQHFEAEFRAEPPMYALGIQGEDLDDLWERARPEWNAPSYDHNAWFFGSPERDLPRWAGYALGYELARRRFAASNGDAVTLAHAPAAEFTTSWPD